MAMGQKTMPKKTLRFLTRWRRHAFPPLGVGGHGIGFDEPKRGGVTLRVPKFL